MDKEGYIYGLGANTNAMMKWSRNEAKVMLAYKLDGEFMQLNHNQEYIEVGKTINLSAAYYNGTNLKLLEKKVTNLTFESTDTDILTVDQSGTVTAKKRGIATVIATNTVTGEVAQSIINVINPNAVAIPRVESGAAFTIMLKEDGTVWSTGACAVGALGTNYGKNQLEPVQVLKYDETPLTGIRKISTGYQHTLALAEDGSVWAWGLGTSGQLGQGNKANSWLAVQVLDPDGNDVWHDAADIDAGYDFSLIITKDNQPYGFGANANYSYGTNNTTAYQIPTRVHYLDNIISAKRRLRPHNILKR